MLELIQKTDFSVMGKSGLTTEISEKEGSRGLLKGEIKGGDKMKRETSPALYAEKG